MWGNSTKRCTKRHTPGSQRLLIFYKNVAKTRGISFYCETNLPERPSKQRRFKRALRDKLTLRTGVWGQRNLAAFGRVNTNPDWKSASRVSSFPSLFDPSSLGLNSRARASVTLRKLHGEGLHSWYIFLTAYLGLHTYYSLKCLYAYISM